MAIRALSTVGKYRMKLDGRVGIVTGGSRGIGRGTVIESADDGADIVVASITLDASE